MRKIRVGAYIVNSATLIILILFIFYALTVAQEKEPASDKHDFDRLEEKTRALKEAVENVKKIGKNAEERKKKLDEEVVKKLQRKLMNKLTRGYTSLPDHLRESKTAQSNAKITYSRVKPIKIKMSKNRKVFTPLLTSSLAKTSLVEKSFYRYRLKVSEFGRATVNEIVSIVNSMVNEVALNKKGITLEPYQRKAKINKLLHYLNKYSDYINKMMSAGCPRLGVVPLGKSITEYVENYRPICLKFYKLEEKLRSVIATLQDKKWWQDASNQDIVELLKEAENLASKLVEALNKDLEEELEALKIVPTLVDILFDVATSQGIYKYLSEEQRKNIYTKLTKQISLYAHKIKLTELLPEDVNRILHKLNELYGTALSVSQVDKVKSVLLSLPAYTLKVSATFSHASKEEEKQRIIEWKAIKKIIDEYLLEKLQILLNKHNTDFSKVVSQFNKLSFPLQSQKVGTGDFPACRDAVKADNEFKTFINQIGIFLEDTEFLFEPKISYYFTEESNIKDFLELYSKATSVVAKKEKSGLSISELLDFLTGDLNERIYSVAGISLKKAYDEYNKSSAEFFQDWIITEEEGKQLFQLLRGHILSVLPDDNEYKACVDKFIAGSKINNKRENLWAFLDRHLKTTPVEPWLEKMRNYYYTLDASQLNLEVGFINLAKEIVAICNSALQDVKFDEEKVLSKIKESLFKLQPKEYPSNRKYEIALDNFLKDNSIYEIHTLFTDAILSESKSLIEKFIDELKADAICPNYDFEGALTEHFFKTHPMYFDAITENINLTVTQIVRAINALEENVNVANNFIIQQKLSLYIKLLHKKFEIIEKLKQVILQFEMYSKMYSKPLFICIGKLMGLFGGKGGLIEKLENIANSTQDGTVKQYVKNILALEKLINWEFEWMPAKLISYIKLAKEAARKTVLDKEKKVYILCDNERVLRNELTKLEENINLADKTLSCLVDFSAMDASKKAECLSYGVSKELEWTEQTLHKFQDIIKDVKKSVSILVDTINALPSNECSSPVFKETTKLAKTFIDNNLFLLSTNEDEKFFLSLTGIINTKTLHQITSILSDLKDYNYYKTDIKPKLGLGWMDSTSMDNLIKGTISFYQQLKESYKEEINALTDSYRSIDNPTISSQLDKLNCLESLISLLESQIKILYTPKMSSYAVKNACRKINKIPDLTWSNLERVKNTDDDFTNTIWSCKLATLFNLFSTRGDEKDKLEIPKLQKSLELIEDLARIFLR